MGSAFGFAYIILMALVCMIEGGVGSEEKSCCVNGGLSLETMIRFQIVSDFLITVAYLSIPLELLYFINRAKIFPFWWVVAQFGAFIVLCGLTHLAAMWTYRPHSFNVLLTQTILKVLTALVSCAVAVSLVQIIPVLLHVKVRELFLLNKTEELNREMDLIRRQEEAGRHVRMLTQEIRRSLDRHTILSIMLEELSKTLQLENCSIWMPDSEKNTLELTHEWKRRTFHADTPIVIAADDEIVLKVQSSTEAIVIPSDSVLGKASSHDAAVLGPMVAVRLPLLRCSNFKGATSKHLDTLYAVMVSGLPKISGREWTSSELEIVEAVSDQVAVALSHAAILEESFRIRDQLADQNKILQCARKEAEIAVLARNEFLIAMNHEMRVPLHSIRALASLLQECDLSPEQRALTETVARSSGLMSMIINDMLDYSRLEDGCLKLEFHPFELNSVFREVANFAIPMARSKGLRFSLELSRDLPQHVIGDEKRLLQVILYLIVNAIKSAGHGSIAVAVSAIDDQELRAQRYFPNQSGMRPGEDDDDYVSLRTEVWNPGFEIADNDVSKIFRRSVQSEVITNNGDGGVGDLQLTVCQKIVQLMNGRIWVDGKGLGSGSVVAFVVKLKLGSASTSMSIKETLYKDLEGLKVLVVDDNLINRMVTWQVLEKLGCEATIVESGRECLATLVQPGSVYELVMLDLWMPEMDGYEVARRIRKNVQPHQRPLLVALTADTDKSTLECCISVGMDGVILKPVSLTEMGNQLCNLLRKRR
ncbi:hypothetical protein KP509_34G043700 [Ceratopteris richardii]|uniref:Ethylene receptor n=1 Tax=Ceratopteris richardii TaxID=49495 RepID=A0A8T2QKY6_CERRI|nr:hypothetical protein KP509_34G043700 [Ceratopteris richardii]KAH7284219.1 hypothetical protein KP509_34G043700 [Ceratopteris richardii]KAH7284220.1 hypothetical protein KP509_34G043700 [Ceratopteris richardii]KAH7284221.1 hypothetical protein KP509_34G043700 [Ceratopteris richardii]KAH7284222.1 hypothetical protein KP509_34G043700 [Ceratopteris richardii]